MGNKGDTAKKCKRVAWYFDLLNIASLNSRMTDNERAVLLSSPLHEKNDRRLHSHGTDTQEIFSERLINQ